MNETKLEVIILPPQVMLRVHICKKCQTVLGLSSAYGAEKVAKKALVDLLAYALHKKNGECHEGRAL